MVIGGLGFGKEEVCKGVWTCCEKLDVNWLSRFRSCVIMGSSSAKGLVEGIGRMGGCVAGKGVSVLVVTWGELLGLSTFWRITGGRITFWLEIPRGMFLFDCSTWG